MPENKGVYSKYVVTRTDGEPVGETFVLEYETDPFAVDALAAYADAAEEAGGYDALVDALREIVEEYA